MPNFLEPKLHGIDWACMPYMFGSQLAPGGEVRIREEMVASVPIDSLAAIQLDGELEDVERSNLEGGNDTTALDALADKYAPALGSEKGLAKIGKTIARLKGFLPKGIGVLVERMMRDAAAKALPDYYQDKDEEDNDSSDDGDDDGAMAEWLFMRSQNDQHAVDNAEDIADTHMDAKKNLRSPKSPKRKAVGYPSPSLERKAGVLTEQTNLVKIEPSVVEMTARQDGGQHQSQTESQDADSQKTAKFEHGSELAHLEEVLRERERMTFNCKVEPLSPPPTLKRSTSSLEPQLAKRPCPKSAISIERPLRRQFASEDASTAGESSQHMSSSHSLDHAKPKTPLRIRIPCPGSSEPRDTRFRRKTANTADAMDWDRARALQQLYVCELRAGRKPKMPEMNCTAGRWGNWARF